MIKLRSIVNQILTESNSFEYLTKEENLSLKLIYKVIRDVVLDFKNQIIDFGRSNPNEQISISDFIKNTYKPHKNLNEVSDGELIIDFDNVNPIIKKTFQGLKLTDKFYIRFDVASSNASIESKNQPLRITGIVIGTDKLFKNTEESLKSSLQHEIQHIANLHKEGNTDPDYEKKGTYNYLTTIHELDSHSKQFAYIYWKKFHNDTTVDIKKLLNIDFIKKSKDKLNLYVWFMYPDKLRDHDKNIDDVTYNKIKETGKQFPIRLNYYLNLFKQKI